MFEFLQKRKIRKAFNLIAGRDHLIDFNEWEAAIGIGNTLLAKRMFALTDVDNSGYIDFDEFYHFAARLLSDDIQERLTFLYQLCDINNDGKVNRAELNIILSSCIQEQGLTLAETRIHALSEVFFSSAHEGERRFLTEAEFVGFLKSVPDVDFQFNSFINRLFGVNRRLDSESLRSVGYLTCVGRYFVSRWKEFFWAAIYLTLNTLLFWDGMAAYAQQGANLAVQFAHGGGACLNLNGGLVLLPMCKALMSKLRHTWLYQILPLDHLVAIHKIVAYAIIAFSVIHVGAHFANYILVQEDIIKVLTQSVIGVTGVVITLILLVIWFSSSTRRFNYERFVLSHLLYSVFLISLLYHGPVFWMWLTPFFLLFAADTVFRTFYKRKRVEITQLHALSDRVTRVHFKQTAMFPFYPGDYIKLRIPALAASQWHPFTLSAAPQSKHMDVHVRNNGNWSGALNNLANKLSEPGQSIHAELDGPYSAPTSSIYRSRVAILIAGGIGVTPFASLLQSVLLYHQKRRGGYSYPHVIHFHWLNRSQTSYTWFEDLLATAEKQLGTDHFKLHIHLTSMARTLSNLVLQIAFDAYWRRQQKDPITGLRARTNAGRPNWDSIFGRIAHQYPDQKVDIYFCGPPGLGKVVRCMAFKHGLFYHEEKFD